MNVSKTKKVMLAASLGFGLSLGISGVANATLSPYCAALEAECIGDGTRQGRNFSACKQFVNESCHTQY